MFDLQSLIFQLMQDGNQVGNDVRDQFTPGMLTDVWFVH